MSLSATDESDLLGDNENQDIPGRPRSRYCIFC